MRAKLEIAGIERFINLKRRPVIGGITESSLPSS
jgi:hypothetical protein